MPIKIRYFKNYRKLDEAEERYKKRYNGNVIILSTLETGRGIRTEIFHE